MKRKVLCVILSCLVLVSSCMLTSCSGGEKISWRYVRKIVQAIQNEDYETFDRLLANIRYSVDGYPESWLSRACESEFYCGKYRESALEEACDADNIYFVKELLERGADPNFSTRPEWWNPLEKAVAGMKVDNLQTKYEIIKLLLEYGANPNVNTTGFTPLRILVPSHDYGIGEEPGLLAIAELFMENGADSTLKTSSYNSPYDYAVEHELYEVLEIIKPRE